MKNLEVTPVPVTIRYLGKKHEIVGQKFNPDGNVMYRFLVELSPKFDDIAIILYESDEPGKKFWWYFENDERNQLAKLIAKALQ